MARLNSLTRLGVLLSLATAFIMAAGSASAQYTQTTLDTQVQDPHLKNAWGMAYLGTGPFWISDANTGVSTVYDADGTIVPLVVTIPPAVSGKGSPTGIVANSTTGFVVTQNGVSGAAAFIFDTLDGTISGWSPSVNATAAVIAVNNNGKANYQALTIATVNGNSFLYAANTAKNRIERYNSTFKLVGTFTDAALTGMTVYGVQAIQGKIFVTFKGNGGGAVDIFTPAGVFVKTLTMNGAGGPLNDPWAVALAPKNFGKLSNALLIGNVDQGNIVAFNLSTGAFRGTLNDTTGAPIINTGLWGLEFGGGSGSGGNGTTTQLFLAAGPNGYRNGTFAVINP
jgi:uncharacterized protein (TIGR03118 family)